MEKGEKVKKKILIDLDVLTVAFWDRKKGALEFLRRIRAGEFELYTPFVLPEIVGKWKYQKLKDEIIAVYSVYSARILSVKEIVDMSKESGINYNLVISDLVSQGVKEEDAILVFVTSAFSLDFLVTYNRTHLRDKEQKINEILESHKMRVIRIVSPESI